MNTTIAIPCEKLLRDAKRVFGADIVVSAWHIDTRTRKHDDKTKMEALRDSYTESGNTEIDLCTARAVMLEMCNGRRVIISTSEWGTIDQPDGDLVLLDAPDS